MDNLNKSVLLSIRPKWCEVIIDGLKTMEIRKSKPKLQTPFKCLIYCTKPKFEAEDFFITPTLKGIMGGGKVIGEFICDKVTNMEEIGGEEFFTTSYMTLEDWKNYTNYTNHVIYSWHISELVIYDTPKELSDFGLSRPPQSWCYVEEVA